MLEAGFQREYGLDLASELAREDWPRLAALTSNLHAGPDGWTIEMELQAATVEALWNLTAVLVRGFGGERIDVPSIRGREPEPVKKATSAEIAAFMGMAAR